MAQIPERITPKTSADYLEVMSKSVFQAGIKWSTIDEKWPAFRKLFKNFDAKLVSAFTTEDIQRLATDESILRSPRKIDATVKNARTILAIESEFGEFAKYLQSFKDYSALAKDLQKRFKYMGALNCYYFLFRVREPVPNFEDWLETIPGDHPRMREMIDLARSQDANETIC